MTLFGHCHNVLNNNNVWRACFGQGLKTRYIQVLHACHGFGLWIEERGIFKHNILVSAQGIKNEVYSCVADLKLGISKRSTLVSAHGLKNEVYSILTCHAGSILRELKVIIRQGWPPQKSEVAVCIHDYFPFRDELTLQNGLIIKGERLVVPTA